MMHTALWLLLKLDCKGSLRGLAKSLRNWRRLLLLLFIFGLIGVMFYARSLQSNQLAENRFGAGMPFWSFIYLATAWLAASADRGLIMRPAEIHFLFGGPFRSREIITLHLIRLFLRSLVSALVLSLVAITYIPSFACGVTGLWLLLAVSLLVGMIVGLMARSIHGPRALLVRRVLTIAVVISILGMLTQAIQQIRADHVRVEVSRLAAYAPNTRIGSWLLPPVAWMFEPLAARDFLVDCLPLLPSRLAIVSALIAGVYWLGADFGEISATRTDHAVARRQSALRSGSAAGASNLARRISISVPQFRLGGIVAVGWWQVVHLTRILPRYLAFTIVIMGILIVLPTMVDASVMTGIGGMGFFAGLSLYGDFLLLLQLPVGFMGPTSQRELLKTLPIPNWRIVVGQLVGPLVPVLVIHTLTSILFLAFFSIPWPQYLCETVALIPAAFVIIACINLLGIWGIIQPRALQQRDVLAAGRAMASVWLFGILLLPASIVATAFGLLAELILTDLLPTACGLLIGAGFGCFLASLGYITLIVRCFGRWQPAASDRGEDEIEQSE